MRAFVRHLYPGTGMMVPVEALVLHGVSRQHAVPSAGKDGFIARLDQIRDKSAVALSRKGAVFTRPALVAEVEYSAWTEDGKLRHPSIKGLRERADDTIVFEIA